ncbi:hypothetical protein V7S76_08725 [Aquirufa sp. ROCK2-A2]
MQNQENNEKKPWQEPILKSVEISGGLPPGTGETFLNGIPIGS